MCWKHQNLEPIKGILVGLYSNLNDTAFQHEPMMRIARTDGNGHFVIKGVAKGDYRIYALQDMDGNYKFNQPGEKIAFTPEIIMPSFNQMYDKTLFGEIRSILVI